MDRKQFDLLRNKMSAFAKINFFTMSDITKKAVGLFCTVDTEIKKDSSIERVKDILKELEFPYTVTEEGLSQTKHFLIRFNQ